MHTEVHRIRSKPRDRILFDPDLVKRTPKARKMMKGTPVTMWTPLGCVAQGIFQYASILGNYVVSVEGLPDLYDFDVVILQSFGIKTTM